MKLNEKQKFALLLWLGTYGESNPIHEIVNDIDRFCNGEIQEWRIFGKFGMAGKLWNSHGKIYVSGHSPSELTPHNFKRQQKEINDLNTDLEGVLDFWK